MNERIKELAEQAGVLFDTDPTYTYGASPKVLERFAELVRQNERSRCVKIIENHQIPVGNSSAGEIACEMTYSALKEIRDQIRGRTE
jgi:phosphatidylserine decarboxylase